MAMNEQVASDDPHAHRRQHSRLRLGLPARFQTLQGTEEVRLLDLSRSGAKLALERPSTFKEGVLSWMDFEAFGMTVWCEGHLVGLRFDEAIPLPQVIETRNRAPDVVRDEGLEIRDAARDWVAGTLHLGFDR